MRAARGARSSPGAPHQTGHPWHPRHPCHTRHPRHQTADEWLDALEYYGMDQQGVAAARAAIAGMQDQRPTISVCHMW